MLEERKRQEAERKEAEDKARGERLKKEGEFNRGLYIHEVDPAHAREATCAWTRPILQRTTV